MPWVLLTDADLQFDLGQLERFVPLTENADLVLRVGASTARIRGNRRVNAAAWNWLVRRAFDLDVRDVDCAFKLIRREVVDGMALTSSGAMISTELLVRAQSGARACVELGVEHRPRTGRRAERRRHRASCCAHCASCAICAASCAAGPRCPRPPRRPRRPAA